MGDAERVLEAVANGPLPVHVVRQQTGVSAEGIVGVLAQLSASGQIVRAGEMVALPEPSYAHEEEIDVDLPDVGGVFDGSEFADGEGPTVDGPEVPVAGPGLDFLVAVNFTEARARSAQELADRVLDEHHHECLIVEAEVAHVYERAVVTRPRER